jgi:hypothetical protein
MSEISPSLSGIEDPTKIAQHPIRLLATAMMTIVILINF